MTPTMPSPMAGERIDRATSKAGRRPTQIIASAILRRYLPDLTSSEPEAIGPEADVDVEHES